MKTAGYLPDCKTSRLTLVHCSRWKYDQTGFHWLIDTDTAKDICTFNWNGKLRKYFVCGTYAYVSTC